MALEAVAPEDGMMSVGVLLLRRRWRGVCGARRIRGCRISRRWVCGGGSRRRGASGRRIRGLRKDGHRGRLLRRVRRSPRIRLHGVTRTW
jgi:hypothetical protein